jgi:hypothetical protein
MLSKIRRVMPNIIAQQIIGVSPMTPPRGTVFTVHNKKDSV